MGKRIIVLLLFLLSGCNSPYIVPSATSSITPAGTQVATILPINTQAPSSFTPTAFPALHTNGPYFSYFRKVVEDYQLVFWDVDGEGRRNISFPQEIKDAIEKKEFFPGMQFVSPDGRWMAFYTGSASTLSSNGEDDQFDLTLKILNLTTMEIEVVAELLSEDYPNNFIKAEKEIGQPEITANNLRGTFVYGITNSISWSPDGQYLAFAGQMEGISSDLYIYEIKEKKIRRLSSGLQQLQWISWSPDSQKILYGSTYVLGMGAINNVFVVNVDGSSGKKLSSSTSDSVDWLNSKSYFEHDRENVFGAYNLRLVNIDSGKVISIWKGSYNSYTVDNSGEWLVLTATSPDMDPFSYFAGTPSDTTTGLYLVNLLSQTKEKIKLSSESDFLSYAIYPFGSDNQTFILLSEQLDSYFLSNNQELSLTEINSVKISVSPEKEIWAGIQSDSISIFNPENNITQSIPVTIQDPAGCEFAWSPDDIGFFLLCGMNIDFVNLINATSETIESNKFNGNLNLNYIWISNQ
jgi:Tol biopolymer transport system component